MTDITKLIIGCIDVDRDTLTVEVDYIAEKVEITCREFGETDSTIYLTREKVRELRDFLEYFAIYEAGE